MLRVPLLLLVMWVHNTNARINTTLSALADMNFTQLCEEFNQPCEQHEVTTEDGYILTVHRIKGDPSRPVLLWHGILDSSDTLLIRGLNSTSVTLAEAGCDVWLGNSRGNKYSRRHKNLNPDKNKKDFWNFSFHEMGYYDLAATIDFVLEKTGQNKLSAIGHSQGTTVFYVLGSTRPIYNSKVKLFISLAPIAYLTNIKPLTRDLIPLWPAVNVVLTLGGKHEVLKSQSTAMEFMQLFCSQGITGNRLCVEGAVKPVSGEDNGEIELEFYTVTSGHFPAGTSKKDVDHYVQVFYRKRFATYDDGTLQNLAKYRSISPPDYNLTKVSAPVALWCAANDRVSTLEDVAILRRELPNVVSYKVLDDKNHIDFVWGKNINSYLNPPIIELLNKFD